MKKIKIWRLGLMHASIAAVAAPIALGLLVGTTLEFFDVTTDKLLSEIMTYLTFTIGVIVGTVYSSNYLKKHYLIPDVRRLTLFAVVAFVGLGIFVFGLNIYLDVAKLSDMRSEVTMLVFETIVFYFVSKKLL